MARNSNARRVDHQPRIPRQHAVDDETRISWPVAHKRVNETRRWRRRRHPHHVERGVADVVHRRNDVAVTREVSAEESALRLHPAETVRKNNQRKVTLARLSITNRFLRYGWREREGLEFVLGFGGQVLTAMRVGGRVPDVDRQTPVPRGVVPFEALRPGGERSSGEGVIDLVDMARVRHLESFPVQINQCVTARERD